MNVDTYLKRYQHQVEGLETALSRAYWRAANSGRKADFDAAEAAELAWKKLHQSPRRFATVQAFGATPEAKRALRPLSRRALEVAKLGFGGNQLPPRLLAELVAGSTEIERIFSTFRGRVGGRGASNNELLEQLAASRSSVRRQACWEGLKQVGAKVGEPLRRLAVKRNEAAHHLGFSDYWDMSVRLQEHSPRHILGLFEQLEQLTDAPYRRLKRRLDGELGQRFGLAPGALEPWHYDNPFFQEPPPGKAVNPDLFYRRKSKEKLVGIATRFYAELGLPVEEVLSKSDLYERRGKDQHAFCMSVDRAADVRILTNVKPTAAWMDTLLHELGHAVYYRFIDRALPYNLREAAHILTTEGIAMLFGALARQPAFLQRYAGVKAARAKALRPALREQRRREQLVFARWSLVMLHFERGLYGDPAQDLDALWWTLVARYQGLKTPPQPPAAAWAAKPHFTIAPVYYHNYLLGELFAAQLRQRLATDVGHRGRPAELDFGAHADLGAWFTRRVFHPGMRLRWPALVRRATGSPLDPRFFAAELR